VEGRNVLEGPGTKGRVGWGKAGGNVRASAAPPFTEGAEPAVGSAAAGSGSVVGGSAGRIRAGENAGEGGRPRRRPASQA